MQHDSRNLTMVMDLYELTMAYGYFLTKDVQTKVAFDVFYRKNPDGSGFAIFAGLEQIIEYIQSLHFSAEDVAYLRSLNLFNEEFLAYLQDFHFQGDLYAFEEGTIMYPCEPILTVVAPLIDAQIIETALLVQINHQSLIATKSRRIVAAAQGKAISDFGARRAHNMDAAVYGARASYIGGASSTSNVLAGQMFGIPVSGTMAHSFVMYYKDEYTAFREYAKAYPHNSVFLIDTYDVIGSGLPNAIRVAKEVLEPMGERLKGVRIDSGDLAYLSKKIRKILDASSMEDCQIVMSNSLDEYVIGSLVQQGAKFDLLGVGERLITARSEPVFGAVYKLCAVEEGGAMAARIKLSENEEKVTNPGLKKVYRVFDREGKAIADLIALAEEQIDESRPLPFVDPKKPWKERVFENYTLRPLQVPIFLGGKQVYQSKPLREIRDFVARQLETEIWQEEQRFENPHVHYLDMTCAYYALKQRMIEEKRG